jgi:hypothetical protein
MEKADSKWLKTKDDGVLLFKNIALSVKESDKEDKLDEEYEHTEENCIINFDNPDSKFQTGQRYFHSEMCVFCTVSDRVTSDDGKLTDVKVRLENLDSEAVIPANDKDLSVLHDSVVVHFRIIQKSGSKLTLKGKYSLFDNMQGNLKSILSTAGLSAGNFKVFHNDKLLEKNTDIDKIYEHGKDITLMAFESLGKPKRWMRFPKVYEYGTWSNSGSCTDGIIYIPNKAIQVSGFVAYAAKDDPDFELKYKLSINDVVKEEGAPVKYDNWEDTHFKTINFNDVYDVPASARVQIVVWVARNISSQTSVYTYYGTDGYSFAEVVNEQMGLFTVESANESSNGTSVSSGNIPGILYYSD